MLRTIILDTNVLVAGLRSSLGAYHSLLSRIGTGLFELGITASLVLEYEDVLKRPGLVPTPPEDVGLFLDYLCLTGKRCAVRFRVRPAATDPGDDLVIEAAIASGSTWIVTHNTQHLAECSMRFGIESLTPAEALTRMEFPQ